MRAWLQAIGLALTLGAGALPARAHDLWLDVPAAGEPWEAALSSGARFPSPQSGIDPARIAASACEQTGETIGLKAGRRGDPATVLEGAVDPARPALCFVRLKPRETLLSPPQVGHYLDDVRAPASVRGRWSTQREPRRWQESYEKTAVVWVTPPPAPVEPNGARAGAADAQGKRKRTGRAAAPVDPPEDELVTRMLDQAPGLTLLPTQAPGALRPDSPLRVRTRVDAAPVAGLAVELLHEEGGYRRWAISGADGVASFRLGPPGRYLLRATELRPNENSPARWASRFSTLNFRVDPLPAPRAARRR